ncbi:MAG TPA: ABC transporter permease [Bryobacteraceae bacterium]|nr:ABC transporter permease [Bryobacteraceae bacterium]
MLSTHLRFTFRTLRKSPAYALTTILTIGLGVGASTAIFSVVNAVMLRALPFASPERLVWVAEKNDKLRLPWFAASVLNYLSWREGQVSFDQLGAIRQSSYNLTGKGEPEQFTGNEISPSLFRVLGVRPVLGRDFQEDEDQPASQPVAIIGEGLWKRRFGGEPSVIGRNVTLNGAAYTVVGVAPSAPEILSQGDIWTPLVLDRSKERRLNHLIVVVGRLKRGVTIPQAQAEMDIVARRVGEQFPEVRDWGIHLQAIYDYVVAKELRIALLVILGAAILVLITAAANVANLLLSRAVARQKEVAVRIAIGASRTNLLCQLLMESTVLAFAGGAVGVAMGTLAVRSMNASLPPNLLPVSVTIDGFVLLFAFAVTVSSGILFGLAPAWQAWRTDLHSLLKEAGRSGADVPRSLVRQALIGGELALATLLLIAAGLLLQSLLRLGNARLGFRAEGLLTFEITPQPARYDTVAKRTALYRDLVERLESLPGVSGAAMTTCVPFGNGLQSRTPATPVGRSLLEPSQSIPIDWRSVSPGYFRTMEIPLLRGRQFTDGDTATGPNVMIVSQGLAERVWGSEDPLGRAMRIVGSGKVYTVIGVVGDARNSALNAEPYPTMYYSTNAVTWPTMDVVLRIAQDPYGGLQGARQRLRELDPDLSMFSVRSMNDWLSRSIAQPRLNAVLVTAFGCLALLMAAIGVYGVLSYLVNQRTREIGLRMALGAQRQRVIGLVIKEGMILALTGIAAGVLSALLVSQVLSSLLYGVAARDASTFAATAITLTLVALAACIAPAVRASRVDPILALRCE